MKSLLAVAMLVFGVSQSTRAEAQCGYAVYQQKIRGPATQAGQPWCHKAGVCPGHPTCTYDVADACPYRIEVEEATYSCVTGDKTSVAARGIWYCPCEAADQPGIASTRDGTIMPGTYSCDSPSCAATSSPDPEMCDGEDVDDQPPFDEGCGDGEYCKAGDHDGAPVRYSSGRVETNPITLFSLPTPEGIELGYRIIWGSHVPVNAAGARIVNGVTETVPTIHHQDEHTHFIGRGWQDSFSDRLFITTRNKSPARITWQSMNGTITFSASSGWKSWSGRYELIDRGSNPADGFGRWVIRTTDATAPRQIWSFEDFTFTSYGGSQYVYTLGRLRRRALLTSDLANLTGRYGYTLTWSSSGTIDQITDTLGRQLLFDYATSSSGGITYSRRVAAIRYKAAPAGNADIVATLQADSGGSLLDRVSRSGVAGYTRFLYWKTGTSDCARCDSMVTDVLVPAPDSAISPASQVPKLSSEIELEHNEYAPSLIGVSSYKIPLATLSRYPGREYAYEHRISRSTQFDLHQETGTCGEGGTCSSGSACRAADGKCYVATIIEHNPDTRQQTAKGFASGGTNGGGSVSIGSGGSHSTTRTLSGQPRRVTDAGGVKTSYGFDSSARVRCIVRNDDDDEAFATPASPDSSACAGPANAQVIRVDYTSTTITKTTASVLSGDVTDVETLNATTLLPSYSTRTGRTRDVDGSLVTSAPRTARLYDGIGRLVEVNGPLPDSTALDKTTTSYYPSFDASWPHNFGRVHEVTRYVGTSTSNSALTTAYSEYDSFGIPHRVTHPDGQQLTYSPSSDRLTWTIAHVTSGATSTVRLNVDGTVRSMQDADGVCVTFEYSDDSGFVGAPTKIRRSNTNCGALPINVNDGEVELRTYYNGEPDRLKTIERLQNGASQFSFGTPATNSYLQYDSERRLSGAKAELTGAFTFGFTDVLPSSTVAPGGPAAGSWRSDTTADELARPTSLLRFLDASNKQSYTYSYATPMSPRPTQLARGYNGSSTAVTNFVYDDFGRLVEAVVPEAGAPGAAAPTRYEYDVAGRMVKKRVAVGTSLVRTSVYSYDSLGRTTYVDHDVEHPVDCAVAAAGTPIQDEEYKYDSCPLPDAPAGTTCDNAAGKLTVARAIVQCGTAGQVVKRGRWYSYSLRGAVARISYATMTGSVIGPAAPLGISYTLGDRLSRYTSPLNNAFGTRYMFAESNMRVNYVGTSDFPGIRLADNITYRAFGPIVGLTTAVAQPSDTSIRTLKMINEIGADFDYNLNTLRWQLVGTSGPPVNTIAVINQLMGYTSSGLLQDRHDTADALSSRYYSYDALLRMTCEARGGFGLGYGSSSDCSTSSPRVAGLYTYGNGEAASSPPDVRMSTFIKSENSSQAACSLSNACYLSPSQENSIYSGGSGQVQALNRTDSSLVLGHDAMGRRSFEYDSFQAVNSRRDYSYLPNGQLGAVTGQTPYFNWYTNVVSYHAYTYAMRYDERGRPVTISSRTPTLAYGEDAELFWDDQDRLIASQITPWFIRDSVSSPIASIRWHYHYLGSMLVAATREIVRAGGSVQVKRFWAATDERGFVYRLFDEQGATFWQARWDATGWRTHVGVPQPEMWMPFGLPGQIVLGAVRTYGVSSPKRNPIWQPGTEAFTSGVAGTTWTRPPIALNQLRAYDPLTGSFLTPDGGDIEGRSAPEGYVYGRSNAVVYMDADGAKSRSTMPGITPQYELESTCSDRQAELDAAIAKAAYAVSVCIDGECREGAEAIKRLWIHTILSGRYRCLVFGAPSMKYAGKRGSLDVRLRYFIGDDGTIWADEELLANGRVLRFASLGFAMTKLDIGDTTAQRDTILSPSLGPSSNCLATQVAHEALHAVYDVYPAYNPALDALLGPAAVFSYPAYRQTSGNAWEQAIVRQASECVNPFCN